MSRLLAVLVLLLAAESAFACGSNQELGHRAQILPHANITYKQADGYLRERRFKELDALIEHHRRVEEFSPKGTPKIKLVYDALVLPAGCPSPVPTDEERAEQLALIQQWIAASPRSTAPRIALAALYTESAWHARSGEYSSKVSAEQWAGFKRYMDMAFALLAPMKKDAERDSYWYHTMIAVGIAQHLPAASFDAMFERGFKRYPEHFYLATYASEYYMTKWFGDEGDEAAFMERAIRITRPKTGDRLYMYAHKGKVSDQAIRRGEIDWPRLKTAYKVALNAKTSESLLPAYGKDMCAAVDEEAMKEFFIQHPDKFEDSDWNEKNQEYCKIRQFGPTQCFKREDTGAIYCEPAPGNSTYKG